MVVDPNKASSRPISDKQKAANQRNAQRSTGPRTKEGKEKSSQNAMKDGIFATRARPVLRGPFAEDESEFYERLEELTMAQGPRDAIEHAIAVQRSLVLIRLDRYDEVSAAAAMGDSRITDNDRRKGIVEPEVARLRRRAVWVIAELLEHGGDDTQDMEWKDLAIALRSHGPEPGMNVRDLWTDDREPKNEDEWRNAFLALLNYFWDDTADAIAWARHTVEVMLAMSLDGDWLAMERAARRILDNQAKDTQIQNRLVRDLERLSKEYARLQERDLA